MKQIIKSVFLTILVLALSACGGAAGLAGSTTASAASSGTNSIQSAAVDPSWTPAVEFDSDDLNDQTSSGELTKIVLENDQISLEGSGAEVSGAIVTVTSPGSYQISGRLDDGQIIVDCAEEGTVQLILAGAEISSLSSSPIFIRSADKTVLTLADGTVNSLSDGAVSRQDGEDELDAVLFSKDDLTVNGSGSLTVTGSYNHGIVSKDDLKIVSGSITITAVGDGIQGKDSLAILDGEIQVTAGGDGLQSTNAEDPEKGSLVIEGGSIRITAGQDGIQAETELLISGGNLVIVSGGGSANGAAHSQGGDRNTDFGAATAASGDSAKGLKAGLQLSISGGRFLIDSADDALHANGGILIEGGEFQIASGDDGLHADSLLEIKAGSLDISQSYEGLESAEINLSGGVIRLAASDDGVNGSTGSGEGGQPGMGGFESGDSTMTISGGYLYVDAGGDGIDINGSIAMTGGTVLVNGPTNSGNGALDYLGEFNISGGTLIAVGSAGMAEAPSQSSSQYSLLYIFENVLSGGTAFHLESGSGEEILTFLPAKEYQAVVISMPALAGGESYQISSGGTHSGTLQDGLYLDGSYSGGSLVDTLTLSSMVTSGGAAGGGMMGVPGGGRPRGRGN